MAECIAIINQKGGVGKSTTANAVGAGLSREGYRVLYIDLDAQGNLSYSMGASPSAISSLEVLTGTATAGEAIRETGQGDIIPASPALASADAIITDTGKEYRLKEALEPIEKEYDYILLDTPPALGVLTINALTASTGVVIPVQADVFSLQGVGQLSQTIRTVRKYCNKDLDVMGIVITRYNPRTIISQDMTELLEETAGQLHTKVYNTKIRECTALKEAQARQQDIFTYSAGSNAGKDYRQLCYEIIGG